MPTTPNHREQLGLDRETYVKYRKASHEHFKNILRGTRVQGTGTKHNRHERRKAFALKLKNRHTAD